MTETSVEDDEAWALHQDLAFGRQTPRFAYDVTRGIDTDPS
jgi:hypothetical protein